MNDIESVKKDSAVYLDHVIRYLNRTIAACSIKSSKELETKWEESQIELSSNYQFESLNEHVWDYYLVFCCEFSEDDLDKSLRFKIESDRFCCRKYFLFNSSAQNIDSQNLVESLFPAINSSHHIQLIKAETIVDKLGDRIINVVPTSFLTENYDTDEIDSVLSELILNMESAEDV